MINWMAFLIVFATALVASAIVVSLYSLGIRFLATPAPKVRGADGSFEPDGPSRDDEDDDAPALESDDEDVGNGGGESLSVDLLRSASSVSGAGRAGAEHGKALAVRVRSPSPACGAAQEGPA